MRTMTTRVGGYKFVIETNGTMVIGEFDAENGDGMSLPFELRSCYTNNNGQTIGILAAAIGAVETLTERVNYTADSHNYFYRGCAVACECESCQIADALFDRSTLSLRGKVLL